MKAKLMKHLNFEILIDANKEKVWSVMISKETYSDWVKAFSPNSEFIGKWKEGAEVQFIDKNKGGTLAKISTFRPYEKIVAEHVATINKKGVVETTGPLTEKWIGSKETYLFEDYNTSTKLKVIIEVHEDFEEMFNKCWTEALNNIKKIAENKREPIHEKEKVTEKKANPVGWFEIYVDDLARAQKFYENVFGYKLERLANPVTIGNEVEMCVFPNDMTIHGTAGAIVKMPGFPAGQNSVLVYFSCNDCKIEESRIEVAGGRVERPKFSIGEYGFISLVLDTENNMIGLHSLK